MPRTATYDPYPGATTHPCGCITLDQRSFVEACPEAQRLWALFMELLYSPDSTKAQKAEATNVYRAHAGLPHIERYGFTGPD